MANFNILLVLTPDDQRPRAVALFQTAVFTSAVVGPILGGYLADVSRSFTIPFLVAGGISLIGMIFSFYLGRLDLAVRIIIFANIGML